MQGSSVKNIGIRVEPRFHARFRRAAKASHRSLEGEIKALMEQRVKEFEAETKEAA